MDGIYVRKNRALPMQAAGARDLGLLKRAQGRAGRQCRLCHGNDSVRARAQDVAATLQGRA
ncbi:hypothetical protein XFF6166_550017 [Xanthomonas citri pv. fuscans]|nr:hypothetical protein XFF6166_550017 [Xanthomonas citri pv. fuscans]SON97193.1 hypothetical protein XFF6990_430091 [Xanthomonas citri pv. fuscans]SON98955.1 hypothetical protein XFF6960_1060054 [Xanthomonas citri pv. fuscans]SOO06165.1 hypothetical protein XFF7767_650017 [Xanthomonas citri pv. fuscans]SOO11684.1 hypothetical protein XFF6970_930055 [Xanthomonas citri pv. fuscans]